jgi:outer membrane protein assembly factor BamB
MLRRLTPLAIITMVSIWTASSMADEPLGRFLQERVAVDSQGATLPTTWSATENVLWKTDLPGLGWSSPIVADNRIFLTTCVSTGATQEPRKGLYIEDLDANKYPPDTTPHQWKVYCLDLKSGKVLWERTAHEGIPAKPHHLKNTLASETAATDGQRVYAMFGNVGLYCYDMQGELLWSHPLKPRNTRYAWGTSQSPIVEGDRVYLINDNEEESYMLALDKLTGETIWRIDRQEQTNYSTPYIWRNGLREEIVISGIGWVQSYDMNGKPLWKIKGKSILAIPTPFAHGDLLYVTSGHVLWGENPFYAIRPGASGDISPAEGETSNEFIAWSLEKAGPYHPTPLIVDGQVYVLLDRGFLTAYDCLTGEEVFGKQRIPKGRAFTSSPWSYDGKLFCINEDGVTFVIKTGAEFEILGTNSLAEDDMCMATPVFVGNKLLIRTSQRLYCMQEGASLATKP